MKYKIKRSEDYLSHHGILGMKWGKKNGPPYPLSPENHSASEKKAGWRKSLNKRSARSIGKKVVNATDKVFRYKGNPKKTTLTPLGLAITGSNLYLTNSAIRTGAAWVAEFMPSKLFAINFGQNARLITSGKHIVNGLGLMGVAYNTIGTAYNITRNEIDARLKDK